MEQGPTVLNVAEAIQQGLKHHSSGNLPQAEALYREVLRQQPENAEALHLLGVIAYQVKRPDLAAKLIRRAVSIDGGQARYHNALAMALAALGDRNEAVDAYRRALDLDPAFGEAHNNLGNALRELGRLDDAAACYRRALELNPGIAEAHNNLGNALLTQGHAHAAVESFRRAIALRPAYAEAHSNLGNVLEALDRAEEAVESCRHAIALRPGLADAHSNLGNALAKLGRAAEAEVAHRRAVELEPAQARWRGNLGVALFGLGRIDEAIASYEQALELDPAQSGPRWNRALARLMAGDYAAGWEDYEWRWEGCAWLRGAKPELATRQWQGESLKKRRIVIHAEQGLGDEIMFASILPELVREAAACYIECSPRLEPIFRRSFPDAKMFGNDRSAPRWRDRLAEWLEELPGAHFQSPIGSLARFRRRSLADFPRRRGYLRADARRVRSWKTALGKLGAGLKVGISWRGGQPATGMARRSTGLAQWLPVLRQRDLRFVSLQYGDCAAELERFRDETGVEIIHRPDVLADLDETAALVKSLDLVVSVCTAVIHLGGALGQRTWVLAPHVPEWRYGLSGETMPWYPSVRIFRQPAPGDWDSVFSRVPEQLRTVGP